MSSIYRITVPRNEKSNKTIARINISVGQEYHEGEKFIATAEWVSRHFNQCVINLCDTLYRHNFEAMNISPQKAHAMAIAAGDAWIERNRDVFNLLPNYKIIRWDEWRNDSKWDEAKETIDGLYKNDPEFKKIIDKTASMFSTKKNMTDTAYSKRYVIEEATFALISSFDDVADVYPGSYLPVFDYMRDKGMQSPQSMTTISFKRKKQQQPQVV